MVQLIRRMKWWRKRAGRRLGRLANGWRETEKRVFQLASSTPPSVELLASSWTRRSSILLISACQNKSKSYQKVVGVLWWLTTTAPMFPSASTHSSFSIFFHISADNSTREFKKGERGFYAMTYKWEDLANKHQAHAQQQKYIARCMLIIFYEPAVPNAKCLLERSNFLSKWYYLLRLSNRLDFFSSKYRRNVAA